MWHAAGYGLGEKKTGAASSPEDLKRLMNVKQFAIENGDL